MRNLIISFIILVAIVALIIIYGIYAQTVSKKLEDFSLSASVTSLPDADKAYAYWLKNKSIIHVGVATSFTDNVSLGFIDLRTALSSNNTEEIAKATENLQFYVSELKRVNCVSWENIL